MPASVDALLAVLTAQRGDQYVWAAEAAFSDPNPDRWDCSELVEWSCHRVHVLPLVPDGARAQLLHCQKHKTTISVAEAIATRGALLFRIGGATNHVAVSLGNGQTIEARGRAYGVNVFPATGRAWTHGALIPGLSYARAVPAPAPATATTPLRGWYHRLLSLGSAGADVVQVQRKVGARPDGEYGPKTRAAVIAYQRRHGLVPDGVVGKLTAAAMG